MSASSRFPVVHMFPRGTYRTPPFYFRGAEALTEPEYVMKQLAVAREEFLRSKRERDREQAEFEEASVALSQKDGYTIALANALGEESSATETNARLRQELSKLTAEIEAVEREIAYYKEQQNTTLVSGLHRERAYYHVEIENLRYAVFQGIDAIREGKTQAAGIVRSPEYCEALQKNAELVAVSQLYQHLRNEMNRRFHTFSSRVPPKNIVRSRDPHIRTIREMFDVRQERVIEVDRLRRELFYTEVFARANALGMIEQIESMNQVLVSFGGERADIEELRAHFTDCQQQDERPRSCAKRSRVTVASARRSKTALVGRPNPSGPGLVK
jgi:hypothetical protein